VPALVRGMSDLLQRSVGTAVAIETRFPIRLNPVLADGNQLELALLNLVVNARDAMPGGGSVVIAAREEAVTSGHGANLKPGAYVCLSVTDTGEGMDEATLARATEPFFTTKGVGKGTGLGLSMVHGLSEQLGGRLLLKSRRGEGTTAELWLPRGEVEQEAAREGRQAAAENAGRATRPLVILVVDDDNLVLMNTAAMLEDLGHRVLEATSAKQALDILRREKSVDLVITDQVMPHMSGTELAQAIKAEYPTLLVILATGYAELPSGQHLNLPKLAKPFGQNDLAKAIADAIHAEQARSRILKFSAR
jgi:CheY-like chemotaxis protein